MRRILSGTWEHEMTSSVGRWVFWSVCATSVGTLVAAGTWLSNANGGPSGEVTIEVPGAASIAVHCGGDETHHGDGPSISFQPDGTRCDIEAPLTAVLPLRGELELGRATRYKCVRDHMDLACSAL